MASLLRTAKRVLTMDAGKAMDVATAAYLDALRRSRVARLLVPTAGLCGLGFVVFAFGFRRAVILYACVGGVPLVAGYVWSRLGRR